ncbi:hypothetical protein BCR44DRAFT_25537 [Catenaria anguillulae PL171]|uniref:Uncharacterized protein n=1 Tax=Catenaria anguillulae PL171 TaxID=765915 RepID=A0A1Y2HSX7_9FUNG|nr:hypothetical protein BCR44DRAFT_25537 [Catenaria anguillulae PL171]
MSAAAAYYPLPCHSTDITAQTQAIDQSQVANAGDNSVIIQIQQAVQAQKADVASTAAAGGRHMSDTYDQQDSVAQSQDLNQVQFANSGDNSVVIQNQNAVQSQFGNLDSSDGHGWATGNSIDQAQDLNQFQFANASDNSINQNAVQNQQANVGGGRHMHDANTVAQAQDLNQLQFADAGDNSAIIQNQDAPQSQFANIHDFGGHGYGHTGYPDSMITQAQDLTQLQFANAGDNAIIVQNQDAFQSQFANLFGGRHTSDADVIAQAQNLDQFQFANAGDHSAVLQNQDALQSQFALTNVDPHGYAASGGAGHAGGSDWLATFDFTHQVQDLNQVQFASAAGGDGGASAMHASVMPDVTEPLVTMSLF